MLSSSPGPKMWITKENLYIQDKEILQSHSWLNDGIILAAQHLLQTQSQGKIFGWQSTQCTKHACLFKPLPDYRVPFIQILSVNENHWITTSNIKPTTEDAYRDTVCIYDSNCSKKSTLSLTNVKDICSFLRPGVKDLRISFMDVEKQTNAYDCGVFAIAYATELVHGGDPVAWEWDITTMRRHLISCLEKNNITPFPKKNKRRLSLVGRELTGYNVPLYCTCRMPGEDKEKMRKCTGCQELFHVECVYVDEKKLLCSNCVKFLRDMS